MGSALFSWALSQPRLGRRLLRHTMGRHADVAALEVHRMMFATTPAQVRADCFRCSRNMDLRPALGSVTVPTVVLTGEADRVITPGTRPGHRRGNAPRPPRTAPHRRPHAAPRSAQARRPDHRRAGPPLAGRVERDNPAGPIRHRCSGFDPASVAHCAMSSISMRKSAGPG